MTLALFLAIWAVWALCGIGTVWFAARFAGSDTVLLNFIIWPIALLGTLCVIAGEAFKGPTGLLWSIASHALKARERAR